jgi:hypothetical protein
MMDMCNEHPRRTEVRDDTTTNGDAWRQAYRVSPHVCDLPVGPFQTSSDTSFEPRVPECGSRLQQKGGRFHVPSRRDNNMARHANAAGKTTGLLLLN